MTVICKTQKQFHKFITIKNNLPTGLSVSIKKCSINLSLNFSKVQTCKGFTSKLSNGNHILFLDLDKAKNFFELKNKMREIQNKYKDVNGNSLSHFYFFSDKEGSFRLWCFSEISFSVYTKILLDAFDYLDFNFIHWTLKTGKATIRYSDKVGRESQKLVDCLESYFVPILLEKMEYAIYDTSLTKKGIMIRLGDNGKITWR